MNIESYVNGAWTPGQGQGVEVRNAITAEPVGIVDSSGIDFAEVLRHGRNAGGRSLRAMTIHDRANMLKALAKYLLEKKEKFDGVISYGLQHRLHQAPGPGYLLHRPLHDLFPLLL